jgi:hypothetical protein
VFARPVTITDVNVGPDLPNIVVLKLTSVETCTPQEAAPATLPQESVNDSGWFAAPLIGDASAGQGGAAATVVKLAAVAQALVPPISEAFARQ